METRKNTKERKERKEKTIKIVSSNRTNSIEDWYILPEVWQTKEIIYDSHIKHGSHIKVEPTYNEILQGNSKIKGEKLTKIRRKTQKKY